jgi:hypothetical protein
MLLWPPEHSCPSLIREDGIMGANLLRIIALLQRTRPQITDMSGLEPHNDELGINYAPAQLEISSPAHSMDNLSDHPTRKSLRGNVKEHVVAVVAVFYI